MYTHLYVYIYLLLQHLPTSTVSMPSSSSPRGLDLLSRRGPIWCKWESMSAVCLMAGFFSIIKGEACRSVWRAPDCLPMCYGSDVWNLLIFSFPPTSAITHARSFTAWLLSAHVTNEAFSSCSCLEYSSITRSSTLSPCIQSRWIRPPCI